MDVTAGAPTSEGAGVETLAAESQPFSTVSCDPKPLALHTAGISCACCVRVRHGGAGTGPS